MKITALQTPADIRAAAMLRELRKARGMSLQALGAGLGVSWQQVSKYELGQNRISLGRLWDLARVLDVPVAFFFDGMAS
jgi:transcriptional regulator with XRE-family HTH domain